MAEWTNDEKLELLLRMPWTIAPEEGDEPGDLVLTCAEIPSAIGTGRSEKAVIEDFYDSLRLSLRVALEHGDALPRPHGSQAPFPWETDAPERMAARFRAVMTPSGGMQAIPEPPAATAGVSDSGSQTIEPDLVAA